MGNQFSSATEQAKLKIKYVKSLGHRGGEGPTTRGVSLADPAPATGAKRTLQCPECNTTMRAKIAKEMFVFCESPVECEECGDQISKDESRYMCQNGCDIHHCNECAREMMGLSSKAHRNVNHELVELMPGDLFFCGPDKWGIHHVIVVKSGWVPVDPEIQEHLMNDFGKPGLQILAIETIESTQGSVGDDTWWYPSTSFFSRDPFTGETALIADIAPGHDEINTAEEPVPMKVLLHPFRHGSKLGPINGEVFNQVIDELAKESRVYGKRTAVGSVLAGLVHMEIIRPEHYRTEESREQLLEKVRESWGKKPICAAVAVKTWQKYFDEMSDDTEEVVSNIFNFMPHWCDITTPSSLVKHLTQHHWVLQDDLDA